MLRSFGFSTSKRLGLGRPEMLGLYVWRTGRKHTFAVASSLSLPFVLPGLLRLLDDVVTSTNHKPSQTCLPSKAHLKSQTPTSVGGLDFSRVSNVW